MQHKPSLRHRPLECIHQQEASIGHIEHALHFTAEVGVSRGIDDIDFTTLIANTDVFGKNGDTAFAFQVVAIEESIHFGSLVIPEKLAG